MSKRFTANPKLAVSFGAEPPRAVRWGGFRLHAIPLTIGIDEDGAICRLGFRRGKISRSTPTEWQRAWPRTQFIYDPDAVAPAIARIAKGQNLDVLMIGTEFQRALWKAMLTIPSGEVITYAALARRCKRPKAVRAAGTACGANPVAVLVPCHRVIASDGSLGGFGGGLPAKRKLLKAEGYIGKR